MQFEVSDLETVQCCREPDGDSKERDRISPVDVRPEVYHALDEHDMSCLQLGYQDERDAEVSQETVQFVRPFADGWGGLEDEEPEEEGGGGDVEAHGFVAFVEAFVFGFGGQGQEGKGKEIKED